MTCTTTSAGRVGRRRVTMSGWPSTRPSAESRSCHPKLKRSGARSWSIEMMLRAFGSLAAVLAVSAGTFLAQVPSGNPTFAVDIAPIIYDHCMACHRPGQAGPFPLTSYEEVKKRGELIVRATGKRFMPPWHAASAEGFPEFRDDRRLSDQQIATLRDWVSVGMPAGDLSRAPKPPTFAEGWPLGRPDIELSFDREIDVPADGPDLYRNV